MSLIDSINLAVILPFLPNIIFIIILLIFGLFLKFVIDKSFRRIRKTLRDRFDILISKWVIKLVVYSIIGLLILANIPGINEGVLKTLGYIITAIVAFSSTTIIGNGMAGIMIKIIRSYKAGDIVSIGDNFGEVAEVRLLHTLIETADKRIVFVPNSTVITGGITNFSEEHPLVKVDVSLGYDLDRIQVEKMLINAAKAAGLQKVFVVVKELGNYSITYGVKGILNDVKTLPFVESNLRKDIIDVFHLSQMEILSPHYISHRVGPSVVVPKVTKTSKRAIKEKEEHERKATTLRAKTIYKEADRLIRESMHKIKNTK